MAEKIKAREIDGNNPSEVLDAVYDILTTIGFEDVLIVASAGKGDMYASLVKGKNKGRTMAQIGMAIKELALELDVPSNELADELSKQLKEAEKKYAEVMAKKEKQQKIDIVINHKK